MLVKKSISPHWWFVVRLDLMTRTRGVASRMISKDVSEIATRSLDLFPHR